MPKRQVEPSAQRIFSPAAARHWGCGNMTGHGVGSFSAGLGRETPSRVDRRIAPGQAGTAGSRMFLRRERRAPRTSTAWLSLNSNSGLDLPRKNAKFAKRGGRASDWLHETFRTSPHLPRGISLCALCVLLRPIAESGLKSLSENWEGSCFRGQGQMARRDEGGYPQRSLTEEQRSQMALPTKTLRAAQPFGVGRRWLDRHSPLRGCSALAAWANTKIPHRRTPPNCQTGLHR